MNTSFKLNGNTVCEINVISMFISKQFTLIVYNTELLSWSPSKPAHTHKRKTNAH